MAKQESCGSWPTCFEGILEYKEETEKQLEKMCSTRGLVSIDENGFIRYTAKQRSNQPGWLKIYPSEIESLILQHPAVSQVV